jgi:hypothetical protein
MKKQTAVEWLIAELRKYGSPVPRQDEEHAKEMEKQQQGYSEEEVLEQLNLLYGMKNSLVDTFTDENDYITMKWFEQFKNK